MTALQDLWQEQRQQRQQELAQRQQQVRETLASFQQERQTNASQLRDDLSLFQLELQQETQAFLARVSQQRQAQAEQFAHLLREFYQTLQIQTSQLLMAKTADRSAMAQQLGQDLSRHRTHLSNSVALLRKDLQEKLRSLHTETQEFLAGCQQQRIHTRQQQVQELMVFVHALQIQVQDYLLELELIRQDRAQQLRRLLQQDRDRRLAEVNTLFQQLSEFRSELRQYRTELSQLIWSKSVLPAIAPPIDRKSASQPIVQSAAQSTVQSTIVAAPVVTAVATVTATTMPVATEAPTIAASVAPVSQASLQSLDPMQLEEAIYNHIDQLQGVRLNEIESALGINRFQAVDALRSLIRKGLITQRDRVYFIQEEMSL